jgi:hypothetical protein
MFSSNPKSATGIDAKLQDIDRKLREVRKAMKDASRGRPVVVPQAVGAPRLARPARDVPRPPEPAAPEPTVAPPEAEALPVTPREVPVAPEARWTPPRPHADLQPPRPVRPAGGRPPRGSGEDKQRFASYFSGSFIGALPLREERRVQRKRAIEMMFVVAVAA